MDRFRWKIVFFLAVINFHATAQNSEVDSLKLLVAQYGRDTNQVKTHIEISKRLVNELPEEALVYSTKALQLADSLNYVSGKALAYKWIGIYYYNQSKNVETLDNWLKSLNLFRTLNDKTGIANILSNIGSLYYNQSDDAKALEYYLQSLPLAEESGNKLRIATVLQNIGNTYLRKKNTLPLALKYLHRALPITEEINNQDAIVTVCTNLGEGYMALSKVDSALLYFNKALKVNNNAEVLSTTFILNNIGKAYTEKQNFELAIKYQKKSVELTQKLKAAYYEGKSLLGLADTYLEKGDVNRAVAAYKNAERLLLQNHAIEELIATYSGLTKAHARMGKINEAFVYQTLFSNYKDSLYNIETDKKLSNLALEYNISSKEKDINLLTKDKALSELELQKQKTTRNAFALGFGLIMIIAFVIYRNYRQKVKTNILLDKQKVQIETLMLNILPEEVSAELQEFGHATPRYYESVSVLFTDFKGFTLLANKLSPRELIEELNESFMAFDDIVESFGLEKIKTIGDSYMCAGGIPTPDSEHLLKMIKAGLAMQVYINNRNEKRLQKGLPAWELRVGVHLGPVVAGVVGKKKYAYDIWGSTVNIASRLESNGEPGLVNVSSAVYEKIKETYECRYRGKISAKNIGDIDMFFIEKPVNGN